jgi:hypothetical protein
VTLPKDVVSLEAGGSKHYTVRYRRNKFVAVAGGTRIERPKACGEACATRLLARWWTNNHEEVCTHYVRRVSRCLILLAL